MKKVLSILALAALTLAPARADNAGDMAKYMKYSTPVKAHAIYKNMEGTWNVKTTMWMAPGAKPVSTTGTSTNELVLGGR